MKIEIFEKAYKLQSNIMQLNDEISWLQDQKITYIETNNLKVAEQTRPTIFEPLKMLILAYLTGIAEEKKVELEKLKKEFEEI